MARAIIDLEHCVGCGLCVSFCKRGNLRLSETLTSKGVHPAETVPEAGCNGCRMCVLMCPSAAICLLRDAAQEVVTSE
jgi:2-oxoglutarate ferredoxin oxidoreductase subunit delta